MKLINEKVLKQCDIELSTASNDILKKLYSSYSWGKIQDAVYNIAGVVDIDGFYVRKLTIIMDEKFDEFSLTALENILEYGLQNETKKYT